MRDQFAPSSIFSNLYFAESIGLAPPRDRRRRPVVRQSLTRRREHENAARAEAGGDNGGLAIARETGRDRRQERKGEEMEGGGGEEKNREGGGERRRGYCGSISRRPEAIAVRTSGRDIVSRTITETIATILFVRERDTATYARGRDETSERETERRGKKNSRELRTNQI